MCLLDQDELVKVDLVEKEDKQDHSLTISETMPLVLLICLVLTNHLSPDESSDESYDIINCLSADAMWRAGGGGVTLYELIILALSEAADILINYGQFGRRWRRWRLIPKVLKSLKMLQRNHGMAWWKRWRRWRLIPKVLKSSITRNSLDVYITLYYYL